MTPLAAIIGVSSSLGYLLPAIIGLESMGVPSPGETALILASVLASQGKLQIWIVIVMCDGGLIWWLCFVPGCCGVGLGLGCRLLVGLFGGA